jgi:porin
MKKYALLVIACIAVNCIADLQPVRAQVINRYRATIIRDAHTGSTHESHHLLSPRIHERNAFSFEYVYTGEVFTNMRGGLSTNDATKYKGNFDLLMTVDLAQVGLPEGVFFLYASQGHGKGLTNEFVGDYQMLSNIDGLYSMRVVEFWYERDFLDGALHTRFGKQDANADFAVVDMAGDFINSSFGFAPNIPLPAWPDGAMGASFFYDHNDATQIRGGVWDGAAEGGSWGVSGMGDLFTMMELEQRYEWRGKPGELIVGLWHHNGEFGDPALPPESGCFGVEMGVQQMLLPERTLDPENEQGLGAFIQYAWAQEDRSEVDHYLGAGLFYRGLIENRDDDAIGLGLAKANFSDFVVGQTQETAIELFYKAQLAPYAMIQPDMQYIARPNGEHRDAFVFGVRSEIVF